MVNSKRLTTKEVARLCNVSDATVKRWDDSGILKSERTTGGHRRFRPDVVARFQRDNCLGSTLEHGDESIAKVASRRRRNKSHSDCDFFHAIAAGCEDEAAALLINEYLEKRSLPQTIDDLLSPAMRRIGELWRNGEISVAEEQLATRTVMCALLKTRSVIPVNGRRDKTAVCLSVEGDFHELPTYLAQLALETEGWDVINYGCNLPLYSLCSELARHSPTLVCIAATVIPDIERLTHDYQQFHDKMCRMNAAVLLGGAGFAEEPVRKRFPAETYAGSFTELAEFARRF